MKKIKVMINGLPGNMAFKIAEKIVSDARFEMLPYSLTGPEISEPEYKLKGVLISLIHPDDAKETLQKIKSEKGDFITIDYTHPSAVNINAALYAECGIPFVMGTTGGDRDALAALIEKSSISAVIAPNMAKQIVAFQAMLEFATENFPNLFEGFELNVRESHQKGKADTSGTAKAVIASFKKTKASFSEDNFYMERDPEKQKNEWNIPEKYLSGHGWHTYTLDSEQSDMTFSFTHNVNGRNVYVAGTLDAALYLAEKIKNGRTGKIYSMPDVLKGA